MRTIKKYVFEFSELSDSAKEKARDWYRQGECDYEWWDYVYELAKTAGGMLGIDINRIYFSGFWSQGDGACFEGSYSYRKGWRKALASEFGGELLAELTKLGEQLQKVQSRVFYSGTASTQQSGHYQHSGCMAVSVDCDEKYGQSAFSELEDELTDVLRWFADWIYGQLEKEYEWLNSDEQVDESIAANGYEFNEDGSIY